MTELVNLYKLGWKKQTRLLWKKQKIANCDFRGIMGNIDKIIKELDMNSEDVLAGYIFRNITDSLQTYADMATLSEKGYDELDKLNKERQDEYDTVYAIDDIEDTYFQEFELATNEHDFIKYIDSFIQNSKEVFIRIGGEKRVTLEKDGNWNYIILRKEAI